MKKTSSAYVLLFMLAISLVSGLAVSAVNLSTRNLLEKNEKLHRNRIKAKAFLLDVPGNTPGDYERIISSRLTNDTIHGASGYLPVIVKTGPDSAIGFEFSGPGFWGEIRGIMVLAPDFSRIVNIRFLSHSETPGLGARIEEDFFTNQFMGLEVAWKKPAERRIETGTSPDEDARNRIDAITGASQTSIALIKFLNSELERFSTYARYAETGVRKSDMD